MGIFDFNYLYYTYQIFDKCNTGILYLKFLVRQEALSIFFE